MTSTTKLRDCGLTLALLLAGAESHAAEPLPAAVAKSAEAGEATMTADEAKSTTRHTAVIGGKKVGYTAVAGTLTLRDDEGKATAAMFYTAYLLDPANTRRPVTFVYNGGPGSSTVWLRMGSFGPRRVVLDAPHAPANPPHALIDNDASLLPESDLVFLDAINTGYSRPLGTTKPEAFMTADSDIDAFARGIERFLAVYGRGNSPKYLLGESYGTSRSTGIANRLQKDGFLVNGLIQIGTILDIAKNVTRGDRAYIVEVPTYALTAAYHGRIPAPTNRDAFLREVIDWAEGPYARALAKGGDLPADEKAQVARQMAGYTGLRVDSIEKNDLRILPDTFRTELLRDKGKIIGDLDTRYTGDVGDWEKSSDFDPAYSAVRGAILATWAGYIRDELGYKIDVPYRRAFQGPAPRFDFRRGGGIPFANYIVDLAEAMTNNPQLKVLSLNGLYDMSTVFYGADYDYRHVRIAPALKPNIRYKYYDTGHMAYADNAALEHMVADIRAFYRETSAGTAR